MRLAGVRLSERNDLVKLCGRADEAKAELEKAAGLTTNMRGRELLLARAALPEPPATVRPRSPTSR